MSQAEVYDEAYVGYVDFSKFTSFNAVVETIPWGELVSWAFGSRIPVMKPAILNYHREHLSMACSVEMRRRESEAFEIVAHFPLVLPIRGI